LIPQHVPDQYRQPSDAAKRCADNVTLASIAGSVGLWLAIRLQDGGHDRAVYGSRDEAIARQLRPDYCTYVRVPPGGMTAHEAEALLDYWRKLRDANVRDDDPAVPMPLMPLLRRDRRRQIRALTRGR
jgi:hypothetical protein